MRETSDRLILVFIINKTKARLQPSVRWTKLTDQLKTKDTAWSSTNRLRKPC